MKTEKTGLQIALGLLKNELLKLENAATTLTSDYAKDRNNGEQIGIHYAIGVVGQLAKEEKNQQIHYCNTGDCQFCTDDCACSLGSAVEIDDGKCTSFNLRIEMDPDTMGDIKYHEMVDENLVRRASGF